jgi:hypothetical protein
MTPRLMRTSRAEPAASTATSAYLLAARYRDG